MAGAQTGYQKGRDMTNLVATVIVCVVTNVVKVDNASGCNICQHDAHGNHIGSIPAVMGWTPESCPPYKPATEKTETTTVVEIRKLTFTWHDRDWTAKVENVLARKVRKWVLNKTWKETI